ncbi:MAG: adenine phosphoribosyltransferase [Coriobacteriaceae bacterium]|nr:adenine phosphoribosyltransferase [Coriobacteriaceae bacterium]
MTTFEYEKLIESIPDYPTPGVVFKDITPLLADAEGFAAVVKAIADPFRNAGVTKVMGAEARGFMLGAPVARELNAGFVPARKPGKLPREVVSEDYDLEYGTATLQVHSDSFDAGDKVLIVDDLVATGGTMVAQIKLVEQLGADLAGVACLMELEFFKPRDILAKVTDKQLHSLVKVS